MSKVVYLDVDGVLNWDNTQERSPYGYTGIEDQYVAQLKRIIDETGAYIVLTSDWKKDFQTNDCCPVNATLDGKYLVEKLAKYNLKITERTDDMSTGDGRQGGRGNGIRKHLELHPEIETYAILDDIRFDDFTNELIPHFVHFLTPLNEKMADEVIEVLKDVSPIEAYD